LDKTLFEHLQLLTDRPVIYGAADPRDNASDQRRIDRKLDTNMFPCDLFEPCRNIALLGGVKRTRRRHASADYSELFIEQFLVSDDNVR
jgi:hypothetical protein